MDQLSLNGFNRPRSAALSQHMSQTSFGRYFLGCLIKVIGSSIRIAVWMKPR